MDTFLALVLLMHTAAPIECPETGSFQTTPDMAACQCPKEAKSNVETCSVSEASIGLQDELGAVHAAEL